MTSLRALLFLIGTALVSGSEVKINKISPSSQYGVYQLPTELADKKTFNFGNFGIANLIPLNGLAGFLPILGGEKTDCDHSAYIVSGQPTPFGPIIVPEVPKFISPSPEFTEKAKPLDPIPEAPVLPPFKVEESVQSFVPNGEYYIETPEATKVDEFKPLAPIPEAPVLPPFTLPELPLKVSVPEPAPCEDGSYIVETPKIEEIKPLASIPEAPVLPPFTIPELPMKVSIPEATFYIEEPKAPEIEETEPLAFIPEAPVLPPFTAPEFISSPLVAPCEDGAYIIEAPEVPKFEEIKPLAPIPEAPVLGPFTLPKLPLEISVPEPEPVFIPYEAPKIYEEKELATISEAPALPPFIAPQPIYYIEPIKYEEAPLAPIPEAPVLPPLTLPEVTIPEPIIAAPEAKFEEIKPLAPIPEAPVLPPFTFTLPEAPLKYDAAPAFISTLEAGYFIDGSLINAKPLTPIPEVPELGPLTLPELPLKVSIKAPVPCPPGVETSPTLYISELPTPIEIIDPRKLEELKPIPAAPILPPLRLPAFPEVEVIPEAAKVHELKPIPSAPELPPLSINYDFKPITNPVVTKVIEEPPKVLWGGFEYPSWSSPELCAHTILKERIIPKFVEKEGTFKVVSISADTKLPFKAYNPGFVSYLPAYGLPVY